MVAAVVSYLSKTFVVEPLVHFNAVRGRVHRELKFYANVPGNNVKKELQDEAGRALRRLSSELDAAYRAVGLNKLLISIRLIPSEKSIHEASRGLIFLSNSVGPRSQGDDDRLWAVPDEIRRHLGIQSIR